MVSPDPRPHDRQLVGAIARHGPVDRLVVAVG
jgi:hypothetical protein